ncbi:MAG: M15 family metallopeptidase, partial [Clostridia bacterium]|nr:M15 family metallopeptidase [Clostridia bacterium]
IIGSTFPEDPKDCPIKITDLRYVSILYVDFEGEEHTGELIVHRKVADDVLDIFYHLYQAKYPLTSVKLLDDYGEPFSDGTSMVENNTSAFCCRLVTGTHHFSKHSYGIAIDVNPALNPYIRPDGSFAPLNSEPYLDRTLNLPGMIDENDLCYQLFKKHGWKWGGHFKGETDYQHFYKNLK